MDDPSDPHWMISRGRTGTRHAFFISHVSEDNDDVRELKNAIVRLSRSRGFKLSCFLDLDDWRYGARSTSVIRDELIESEHMVLWVTPNYLQATRGWTWIELAYGELIQLRHVIEDIREVRRRPYTFVYPIFRSIEIGDIGRSALSSYWDNRVQVPRGRGSEVRRLARVLVDEYWNLHSMPLQSPPGT